MLLKGITLLSLICSILAWILGALSWWQAVLALLGIELVLLAAALAFLAAVCALVDSSKPQEHDDPFYRRVMYVYIEALMNLAGVRLKTRGLEKTPRQGRFLLVCNHLSMADPGILLHSFRNSQLAFVTKQENQSLPIINKFMHKIMCQNINRENNREALKTILKCIQLIREDEVSIAIFPEGYSSRDGKLHPFRPGAFKIAQKTGVPIVVCTLQGTFPLFHNMAHLRLTHAELHLVDVIPAQALAGKTTVEVSAMVYEMMIADLGEDFRTSVSAGTSPAEPDHF